jgi:uncharacterized repeat protein (TIGR01451 family)
MFNISLNDLDIEFSDRDINFNEDPGSRVVYGSSSGNVQFDRRSNSIPLCTYGAASIMVNSYFDNYSCRPGELNSYKINFINIGSEVAKNLTISLLIPGIIDNPNNFTLRNNNLSYYLPEFFPLENRTIEFSFYVPNSISLNEISVVYHNQKNIQEGNSSKIISYTNQVFITAPINYNEVFPFIRTVEIENSGSELNNNAPAIGEKFNITLSLKNTGPEGFRIPNIKITMNDQFGDLKRVGNRPFYFEDIAYGESINFNVTLKKTGWKGYYYPPINFLESTESRTLQISASSSKVLGKINFSIVKSVDKNQIEVGDSITVYIEVENTGTISIENIRVSDMISYSQLEFSLIEGRLVNVIESLEPGVKVEFYYTIKAKKQALVNLNPASIRYYYLHELVMNSNTVLIKIITPKLNQLYYVVIPLSVGILILIVYFWQINKYRKKRRRYQRTEMQIFALSSRETILKREYTLRDRLSILSKQEKHGGLEINKNINENDG